MKPNLLLIILLLIVSILGVLLAPKQIEIEEPEPPNIEPIEKQIVATTTPEPENIPPGVVCLSDCPLIVP